MDKKFRPLDSFIGYLSHDILIFKAVKMLYKENIAK